MIEDNTGDGTHVAEVDRMMQLLLQLTHKASSTSKYKELFRSLKKHLVLLDTKLVAAPVRTNVIELSAADGRLVATLRSLLPTAAMSYEQALIDLRTENRLSWRGPATDLREALRKVLDQLAPDEDVKVAPGFKMEPDARGPTMKQKVRYVLKNRRVSKSISEPTENAATAVEEALGTFVRSVYTRSSVSTHTSTSRDEALRVLDLVRVVLCELLEVR
ncbi:hypothetical protein LU699_16565 [Luteimonas fraxinea]|uniref:pPIWI-associating nuclease domain-containing protein n=1 Tax=Luteimonas fraxinea TaxID=2901869 RepID=UPI001E552E13|nr:hypothetical protein [Luteimonas fraxinea]UHH09847.1 hypothetical protein LU699_16565 [Luteimonas fraxinea]